MEEQRHSHLQQAVFVQKGRRMKADQSHALKNELEQLDLELKRFKEHLLTTRIEELKQVAHAPSKRSHRSITETNMLTDR